MATIDRIFDLISKKMTTQKKLAEYLDINNVVITDWKSGKSNSYAKYIDKLAEFFQVSTDYLLCKTNDPTPPNKKAFSKNQEGKAIYNSLVEIGAIKAGEEITDKQANALLEYFINNKDYIRFVLDKNK